MATGKRITVNVPLALELKLREEQSKTHETESALICRLLAEHLNVDMGPISWGGKRNGKEEEAIAPEEYAL